MRTHEGSAQHPDQSPSHAFLLLLLSSSTTAQNPSSCVTCHTDEAVLKKTCKPFVIPEGEGEG